MEAINAIHRVFGTIAVVEEEIARFIRATPHAHADPCQYSLLPFFDYVQLPEGLYRLHCRELLQRIYYGQPLPPATDAELLWTLSEMSLIIPLQARVKHAYFALYASLYPQQQNEPISPVFEEEVRQVIDEMRYEITFPR